MTVTEQRLTPEQSALVKAWMSMAHGVAKGFWERSGKTLSLDDMVSAAYHGLVQAALKFEPDRPGNDDRYEINAGFGNYAKLRVKGAILDWQRQQDHVPRRQRATYKTLQDHGHGSGRSAEELSDLVGVDVEKIRAIVQAVESGNVSFDDVWQSHETNSGTEVESTVVASQILQAVVHALEMFPQYQRSIVVMRLYLGYNFNTIATELGLPVSTVRSLNYESLLVLGTVMRDVASHT